MQHCVQGTSALQFHRWNTLLFISTTLVHHLRTTIHTVVDSECHDLISTFAIHLVPRSIIRRPGAGKAWPLHVDSLFASVNDLFILMHQCFIRAGPLPPLRSAFQTALTSRSLILCNLALSASGAQAIRVAILGAMPGPLPQTGSYTSPRALPFLQAM